ncbi:DUF7010 family protein [Lysinibacillus sp. LZ02]|uniref:DUF7010 family protein n=1 Tax=Lysinibacillus sp. LZ02 TaxID=3420668 RepID=UPI003D36B044
MKSARILQALRTDLALRQLKGIHFIIMSVFLWSTLIVIQATDLHILMKNLLTFCATGMILPGAYYISKLLRIDFSTKDNPLSKLGLLFTLNQLLYLLIAMWIYPTLPEYMLMVIAIVFGAHLLPFGWLYHSKSYTAFAIIISFLALIIGLNFSPLVLAIAMLLLEIIFVYCLYREIKQISLKY